MLSYRIRCSRRSVLVLMFAVSVACYPLAMRMKRVHGEQHAKRMVEHIGGRVTYFYNHANYPRWVASLLGDEFAFHRTMVDLSHCPVTEDELACLGQFERPVILLLSDTPVGDESLDQISKLTDLKLLFLDN